MLMMVLLPNTPYSLSLPSPSRLSGSSHRNIFPLTPPPFKATVRRWSNHDRSIRLCASADNNNEEPENETNTGQGKNRSDSTSRQHSARKRAPATNSKDDTVKPKPSILEMINPFNAGKSLRSTVESAIDLASAITNSPASRLPPDRRSIYYNYYLDDQLGLSGVELKDDPKYDSTSASSSHWLSQLDDDYRPEVLVVGAAGALGKVLVKRLVLENKVRVRVMVRDLYSSTLNKLGTGVTYCQGDLNDMESLEYAVTDVDKIVFCAGGRRHQEGGGEDKKLEAMLNQLSRDAQMIDGAGLRNLLHAYVNVRHADYGTSQAAKRVLFKFQKRPADITLFGIDDGSADGDVDSGDLIRSSYAVAASTSQCAWKSNKFGHGIFVGKVRRDGVSGIASVQLKSRSDPSQGIDLRSGGFAGLICRVCSDGGVYEAFVRTEAYERLGVEYVCEFKTSSKSQTDGADGISRTKWLTVRLAFADFRPRMRLFPSQGGEDAQRMRQALGKSDIPPFMGRDIRQLGFRYRGKSNGAYNSSTSWIKFYLALDYIKVYRGQPEPEFVYLSGNHLKPCPLSHFLLAQYLLYSLSAVNLSDARIPPVVNDAMVNHNLHRLVTSTFGSSASYSIIDEAIANKGNEDKTRIAAETYFKYMGEEMIKLSGLR
jgi:hypothetical protein